MATRDQSGNRVGTTDEYGNTLPTHGHGGHGAGDPTNGDGQQQLTHPDTGYGEQHAGGGAYKGTGGGEHNGAGGASVEEPHEKKGIIEKVKEKHPGSHQQHRDDALHRSITAPAAPPRVEQQHEKKGIIEKVKEKLPGSHQY